MAMRSSFSPFSSSDSSSSLLTVGDHLCSAFLPFIGIIETLIFVVTDCFQCHPTRLFRRPEEPCHDFSKLAVESRCFTVREVEALHELFKKLSSSIIEDGRMHKLSTPSGGTVSTTGFYYGVPPLYNRVFGLRSLGWQKESTEGCAFGL